MKKLLIFILTWGQLSLAQVHSEEMVADTYSPPIFQKQNFPEDAPKYLEYKVPVYKGASKPPELKSHPIGYEYRTEIKEQGSHGIDFAGHYRVVLVPLRYGLHRFIIIDAITGKIYTPPDLSFLQLSYTGDWGETDLADDIVDSHLGVGFQKNSSLLIVAGTTGSSDMKQSKLGVHYYLWKNNQMKLLRFAPYENTRRIRPRHP